MNSHKTINFVNKFWDESIIPELSEFIRIPCKSMDYDADWEKNNYLHIAAELIANWARLQGISGLKAEILKLSGRSPTLFIEIPGQIESTILFYGHLDKMPENNGWEEGLGPWQPVLKDHKLYGRGAVDDGYAPFAAIAAIKALQEQKIPHARCVLFIEGGEESGSPDLGFYLDHFRDHVGAPDLIIGLDAVSADYERLWQTVSLRGIVSGTLSVGILKSDAHSGSASGIVPSTFRILRQLLERVEDQITGKILIDKANVSIPKVCLEQAKKTAAIIGENIYRDFIWQEGCQPVSHDIDELILNNTWRPTLCVIGAEGLPEIADASYVLRAMTKVELSMRIPPRTSAANIARELKEKFEVNPPYGAYVSFKVKDQYDGWDALQTESHWLVKALEIASKNYYGKDFSTTGVGGSIGSVPQFTQRFPLAQVLLIGAVAPDSGAHGPNEFLHIPTAKKLTCSVAHIVAEHAAHQGAK